ncbi:hypothetical protein MMC28_005194 [Mycoblastus sanguinarius]|nr:hypothetical protein [Mycoblastus sanguinarius]
MFTTKMSILYFYRRIFPQRWFKYTLIAAGTIVSGSAIAQLPCDILQCRPIRSQWDPNVKGKCSDFGSIILGFGVLNIITDVMLLILPLPVLWRLKISASRKRLLISVFLLGGLACVVSLVRAFYVEQYNGSDPAWDDVNTAIISTVELGIGVLSASMPCYLPLYNYCFKKKPAGGTPTKGRSKSYKQTSADHGAIKMAGLSKSWHRDRELLESEDGERLDFGFGPTTRFGTVAHAQGDEDRGDQRVGGGNDIWVTREFITTSVDPTLA